MKKTAAKQLFFLYTHGDSNSNRRNRNPIFYPLNYGCMDTFIIFPCAKVIKNL